MEEEEGENGKSQQTDNNSFDLQLSVIDKEPLLE
jgi:hypothetical protein